MPVAVIAKLTAQPGRRDELVEALRPLLDAVEGENGTLLYSCNLDDREADVVWFYELYADGDALKAHSTSEAMTSAIPKLGEVLAGGMEIHRCTPVAGKNVPA